MAGADNTMEPGRLSTQPIDVGTDDRPLSGAYDLFILSMPQGPRPALSAIYRRLPLVFHLYDVCFRRCANCGKVAHKRK